MPGTFTPTGATMTYTWLRNGRAIPARPGRRTCRAWATWAAGISVRIHLSHRGYRDRTVTLSADGRVTTRPTLSVWTRGAPGPRGRPAQGHGSRRDGRPGGRATVRIGDHRATGRLEDGRLRVVIGDLGAGVRNVRVSYAGTDIVRPERLVTTVRVPRR